MKLESLAPNLDEEPLCLPLVGGDGVEREYAIPPCDGNTYLILMAVEKGALTGEAAERLAEWAKDQSEHEQWRRVLGPALDEMLADRVPAPRIMHALVTARYWHLVGDEAARLAWAGELGKAPSPDYSTDTPTP